MHTLENRYYNDLIVNLPLTKVCKSNILSSFWNTVWVLSIFLSCAPFSSVWKSSIFWSSRFCKSENSRTWFSCRRTLFYRHINKRPSSVLKKSFFYYFILFPRFPSRKHWQEKYRTSGVYWLLRMARTKITFFFYWKASRDIKANITSFLIVSYIFNFVCNLEHRMWLNSILYSVS